MESNQLDQKPENTKNSNPEYQKKVQKGMEKAKEIFGKKRLNSQKH